MPDGATLDLYREEEADVSTRDALGKLLETVRTVRDRLPRDEAVQDMLCRMFGDQVRAILPLVVSTAASLRRQWQRLLAAGRAGDAAAIHAERDPLVKAIENKLGLLEQSRRLAEMAVLLTGQTFPESLHLQEAEGALRQFKADFLDRWHTLEDLEELLAATFPLPTERLEAVGRQHKPPPHWYAEEGKPF